MTTLDWALGLIATFLGILVAWGSLHSLIAQRKKSDIDRINLLWDRVDKLEKKLQEEIEKNDTFADVIDALRKRIKFLEGILRSRRIPIPEDETPEVAIKKTGSLRE